MFGEIIKNGEIISFEKFSKIILEQGMGNGLLSKAEKRYGEVPSWLRVLQNFDPIGVTGALDQLASEKISEREQNNILKAMYELAQKVYSLEAENKVPTVDKLVYSVGMLLDKFERKMREASNLSVEDGMKDSFIQAGKFLFEILDDFLPSIKAVSKNSLEIENELIYLNKLFSIYGANLDRYIWQENAPLDSVYMRTGGLEDKNERELSLRAGNFLSNVFEQIEKVRQALKADK